MRHHAACFCPELNSWADSLTPKQKLLWLWLLDFDLLQPNGIFN